MKVYFNLFKLKLINMLQYRAAAISGIFTQLFFGFVFILVYLAFYNSNSAGAPMTWNQLVSYVWLNQVFYALTYVWIRESNLISMIKKGNIAYELCRPISFYKKWYSTMYGNRIADIILKSLPVMIFAFLLPSPYQLSLPVSFEAFILFLISMLLSSLLVTSIALIYHIFVFYTLDERGMMTFLIVLGELFSGGTIPIAFFPKFLATIADFLPFKYLVDLPFKIYIGTISINAALYELMIGIIWFGAMIFIGQIITKRALRKAVIQGG